ncbi:Endonuclease/exonuclease/phosphatase, partial [Lenzites betulinus]
MENTDAPPTPPNLRGDTAGAPGGSNLRAAGQPKRSKGRVKIVSLNVRGAGTVSERHPGEKWLRIHQLIKEKRIGILAVQEAHLTQERADVINALFENSIVVNTSPDPTSPAAARGVAIVVNKSVFDTGNELACKTIVPGRAMEISLKWGARGRMRIVNVYAPNDMSENANFWRTMHTYLEDCNDNSPDLIIGDFNMVEERMDRAPAREDPNTTAEALQELRLKWNLVDGWRNANPNSRKFSYMQIATGSQSRIDRMYIAENLVRKSADWRIEEPGISTDHSLVSMTIANYADPFVGPGRWVIPRAVITDRSFLDETVKIGAAALREINDVRDGPGQKTPQEAYEDFKANIRTRARKRVKELFAKWDKKILALKEKIESVM